MNSYYKYITYSFIFDYVRTIFSSVLNFYKYAFIKNKNLCFSSYILVCSKDWEIHNLQIVVLIV